MKRQSESEGKYVQNIYMTKRLVSIIYKKSKYLVRNNKNIYLKKTGFDRHFTKEYIGMTNIQMQCTLSLVIKLQIGNVN